jgi:hypothetical protein
MIEVGGPMSALLHPKHPVVGKVCSECGQELCAGDPVELLIDENGVHWYAHELCYEVLMAGTVKIKEEEEEGEAGNETEEEQPVGRT